MEGDYGRSDSVTIIGVAEVAAGHYLYCIACLNPERVSLFALTVGMHDEKMFSEMNFLFLQPE